MFSLFTFPASRTCRLRLFAAVVAAVMVVAMAGTSTPAGAQTAPSGSPGSGATVTSLPVTTTAPTAPQLSIPAGTFGWYRPASGITWVPGDESDAAGLGGLDAAVTAGAVAGSGDLLVDLAGPFSADGARSRYASLATAFIDMYASSGSMSLDEIVRGDTASVSAFALGDGGTLDVPDETELDDGTLDLDDLNAALPASMAVPASFDTLRGRLQGAGVVSLDESVTAAGASFAAQMAAVRSPSLDAPATAALSLSDDSLLFGLVFDRSLTAMVVDQPDLYAQLSSTGMLSPEGQTAWKSSLQAGASIVSADLGGGLLDPCQALMVAAVGTGSASSARAAVPGAGSCGSCLTAGLSLNSGFSGLFDGKTGGLFKDDPDVAPSTSLDLEGWGELSPAQQSALLQANPTLQGTLDSMKASQPIGKTAEGQHSKCASASQPTVAALQSLVPTMLSGL